MLSEGEVCGRSELIGESLGYFLFPDQEVFFVENFERYGWEFAFLHFHCEDEATNCQGLKVLDLAESLSVKVKVDVGAGESKGIPHNPLLASLTAEETADALNYGIFTALMFSVILVESRI